MSCCKPSMGNCGRITASKCHWWGTTKINREKRGTMNKAIEQADTQPNSPKKRHQKATIRAPATTRPGENRVSTTSPLVVIERDNNTTVINALVIKEANVWTDDSRLPQGSKLPRYRYMNQSSNGIEQHYITMSMWPAAT